MNNTANNNLDRPAFVATVLTIAVLVVPMWLAPEQAGQVVRHAYDTITANLGFLYQWYGIAVLGFLLYLAFSRYGHVRLGPEESRPEFSTLSWVAMLFSAGIGAGLLYWAVIEWGYYIDSPPFGLEPRSPEAVEWAASYGLFHWGVNAWAFYCLPALAIAYPFYVRKVPYLRLSTGCMHYLPGGVTSRRGRVIDFLYMVNLIGGTGTSLGLSSPMIAASFAELAGVTHDFALEVMIVIFCIGIFGTSAYLGLEKGFKKLADLNLWLALTLLFFVLAVGPSLFILKMGTNGVGLVFDNLFRLLTWTDPVSNTRFVEDWTIFYWAWWVAYGPFVGIFVTRISYGRTIREVIGGMLLFGSLGAWLFFIVFGNYAMHLELSELLPVTTIVSEQSAATAITAVFSSLPLGTLAVAAFFVVAVVFLATTYDSASFTLASVSTKELHAGENPARWLRVFWACSLGILPITLMFVDGGIKVVLSTTIVVSVPLLFVGYMMARSLIVQLKEDHPG
ncbi:BCCT family transporter [Pseudohalioglobus sediminis]|uniref:BCCT family transporter n=1 Tax=Pseudohalioglobus sediminis TaxID=2606449 RepID=A0A5B0WMW4_9GAMM|nr:BCCT family transporter [Pseudohalioglobus sediminis]KAA1188400.1 BCCT family transporter [Pseudohalioglobus sediminis]